VIGFLVQAIGSIQFTKEGYIFFVAKLIKKIEEIFLIDKFKNKHEKNVTIYKIMVRTDPTKFLKIVEGFCFE